MRRIGNAYYQPSGILPRQALLGLAACVPAAVVLALAHAWLRQHWLDGALAWPLVLLAGIGLAGLLLLVARRNQLRHPLAGVLLALGIGSLAWQTQRVAGLALHDGDWLHAWPPARWMDLLSGDAGLAQPAGGSALRGVIDWLALTLPAAVLLHRQARQPFCETRRAWIEPCRSPRRFCHIDDVEGFVRRAEGNPADLVSLFDRPAESTRRWAEACVYRRAAGHDCYLRIDNVRLRDSQRPSRRRVLRPMRITPYQAAALLAEESSAPNRPARRARPRAR